MKQIEPHTYAAFYAANTALGIASLLPRNDLVDELLEILSCQCDIFYCICENIHYGSEKLENFLDYLNNVDSEVERLKAHLPEGEE